MSSLVYFWKHLFSVTSQEILKEQTACGDKSLLECFHVSTHFLKFCLFSLSHQRQAKYSENKLKSIKARNEYLLTLEATNASIFKYYIHDLSDLIDVSTGKRKGGSGILPQTKKLWVTSRTVINRVSNWRKVSLRGQLNMTKTAAVVVGFLVEYASLSTPALIWGNA